MAYADGVYVDAGSFLGASAHALASGFSNARPTDRTAHVHCFDAFQTSFPETCALIEKKSGIQASRARQSSGVRRQFSIV
ncbi:MAG: hypothetical protein ABJL99_19255 [Aliishimia sp.]